MSADVTREFDAGAPRYDFLVGLNPGYHRQGANRVTAKSRRSSSSSGAAPVRHPCRASSLRPSRVSCPCRRANRPNSNLVTAGALSRTAAGDILPAASARTGATAA